MPFASLFSTEPIQKILVDKIQKPIVDISSALGSPKYWWQWLWLAWYAFKTIQEIRKLPRPTRDNVSKHNSKVFCDIRDWFLEHEAPDSPRRMLFEGILNFFPMKYDFDNFTGRRIDAFRRKWMESDWIDSGKMPETYWKLNEEDQNNAEVKRYKALQQALINREFDKVPDLID